MMLSVSMTKHVSQVNHTEFCKCMYQSIYIEPFISKFDKKTTTYAEVTQQSVEHSYNTRT